MNKIDDMLKNIKDNPTNPVLVTNALIANYDENAILSALRLY